MTLPAITHQVSLDFRRTSDAEQRPYFVIGAINGAQTAINELAAQYRAYGLEVITINPGYRNSLSLSQGFRGIGVFIQNHNQNDIDHTRGMHTGSNIFQTFNAIQRVQPLVMNAHGINELNQLQGQRQELGGIADEVMPQFAELDRLVDHFQENIQMDETAETAPPAQNKPKSWTSYIYKAIVASIVFLLSLIFRNSSR